MLGSLVTQGLTGPHGLLPKGWRVYPICHAGSDAYRFETLARSLDAFAVPPKAAVVVINLRSLNRLGTNGFYDQLGGASTLLPLQRETA
ncbi:MAG: hypothetical protein ACREKE_02810, partial [bacterium]